MTVYWHPASQLPVLYIADALALLLVIALVSRKATRTAHFFLICAIVTSIISQHISFLLLNSVSNGNNDYLYLLRIPFALRLTNVTLLYLYVLAISTPGFQWNRRLLLYFWPLGIGIVCYLVGAIAQQGERLPRDIFLFERYARVLLGFAIEVTFALKIFERIRAISLEAKKYFSNIQQLRLNWLSLLMGVFLLFILIDFMDLITGPFVITASFAQWAVTLSLFLLAFFSLRYSSVFALSIPTEENGPKGMSEQELIGHRERLLQCLNEKEPYLNPELRLSDLASMINLKPYRLTEVIHRGLDNTFYEVINERRIERAKRLLRDPKYSQWKLIAIAEECGFNSKSVFNDLFKKFTLKTPSQYRESVRNT